MGSHHHVQGWFWDLSFFALQNPNGASKAEKLGGKRALCEGSGCKGEFGGNEHEKGMIAL